MANKKKITLNDDILWAVVRKSWFGGGVVQSVWPTKTSAQTEADNLKDLLGGTYVVQRAPYRTLYT